MSNLTGTVLEGGVPLQLRVLWGLAQRRKHPMRRGHNIRRGGRRVRGSHRTEGGHYMKGVLHGRSKGAACWGSSPMRGEDIILDEGCTSCGKSVPHEKVPSDLPMWWECSTGGEGSMGRPLLDESDGVKLVIISLFLCLFSSPLRNLEEEMCEKESLNV